jgi:alpha-ketoglutarate-dependent 2,4-dichlorophenoxyacetate dioxygenase
MRPGIAVLKEAVPMNLSIRQLHPVFAGEVAGCDLTKPISRDEVAALEAGMDRYAVLVLRDQRITDEQQLAFTRNFGEIESSRGGHITMRQEEKRLGEAMIDVSNLDERSQPLPREDRRRMFNLGNRLWHSDSSFRAVPAKYSILSGRVVAVGGGETEFADMRAAYDELD